MPSHQQNAAATEEMTASSSVVSKAVEATAGVAEENSAASEEVSAQVEESLTDMSEELERTVAVFKTGGDVGV